MEIIHGSDYLMPDFPNIAAANRFARERATQADCPMRVIVEEKKTGRRKVEYVSDGAGNVKQVPIV